MVVDFSGMVSDAWDIKCNGASIIVRLTIDNRRITTFPFRSLELALEAADRMKGGGSVLMGDCPYYWVTTRGDGQRLERAGYEVITRSSLERPG